MTTATDYALMAGHAYRTNRNEINWIPFPNGWLPFFPVPDPTTAAAFPATSGFEAISFTNGAEIVISFAGTDPSDIFGDIAADLGLAAGLGSSQLLQAAQYYLQIKEANPNATISFTGHSLGGGLASLMAVLFGETAYTFDQAPFRSSALFYTTVDPITGVTTTGSVAQDLRHSLTGRAPVDMLSKLDAYIAAADPLNLNPIAADTLAGRETRVTNLNVQGEILSNFPTNAFDRIGLQADANNLGNSTAGVLGSDLHSQALLTAFLQSGDTKKSTAADHTLGQVTFKLTDLLKMIFDPKLYFNDPLKKGDDVKENFLERLVKHQATVIDTATGETDAMVTRFTSDLWKLAQDGGLTMRDDSLVSPNAHYVNNALIAFAMQKYYEETSSSAGYRKELFTDLAIAGEGSGGIRFDMADVSTKFATAFAQGDALNLIDAKGYAQYFKTYLQQSTFTAEERSVMAYLLPSLRDWYVQAGAAGMNSTDTLNRGAFMLGGAGVDTLTGGAKADLLVGNAGNDSMSGGAGNDYLLGGAGSDTLDGGVGNDSLFGGSGTDSYQFSGSFGLDTIRDQDGQGRLSIGTGTTPLSGGKLIADSVWESDDKKYRYTQMGGQLIVSLNSPASAGSNGTILVKDWVTGDLGLAFGGVAEASTRTNVYTGDFIKRTNWDGTTYLFGTDGNYLSDGVQLGALDLITGGAEADLILGLGGDDALLGRAGDDLIDGGAVIDTKADKNIFRFGDGITEKDITLRLGSLMLDLGNGDEIHIEHFNPEDALNSSVISGFEFADGMALDMAGLLARGFDIDGTEQSDSNLRGTSVNDRIRGLARFQSKDQRPKLLAARATFRGFGCRVKFQQTVGWQTLSLGRTANVDQKSIARRQICHTSNEGVFL